MWQISAAARGASDVIDVIGGDSETPGAGHRRTQRKRVKRAKAMESMRQEDDMDWEEENGSERRLRNDDNFTSRDAAADKASEEA